jgi:esterase/lipase
MKAPAITSPKKQIPSSHVTHLFDQHIDQINQEGEAEVNLAGRSFIIGKRFLDDLLDHNQKDELAKLQSVNVLIMHSPDDQIVPLDNAGKIYSALHHPKSFISLSGADHILTNPDDAAYVASLIKVWASKTLAE